MFNFVRSKRLPILEVQSLYNDFNTDPKNNDFNTDPKTRGNKIEDLIKKINEFNNKYVKVTKTDDNVLEGFVTTNQCRTGNDKMVDFFNSLKRL
jgi:hypothetical protein